MQPPGHTWWDIIEEHARRFPERDALAHGDGAITYGELAAREQDFQRVAFRAQCLDRDGFAGLGRRDDNRLGCEV
ncbi:hypothetical protein, partial [Bordetella pertussis]|uniref:hypothetical protein n=1 Tax=Bordetella pertussis TaxID=520 RepID=UPI00366BA43B